ncbi:MAG: paraquat-inducible protein A [Caulobacteraceae bacterium]
MTIGCPECGALDEIPPLGSRTIALCPICRSPLERTAGRSLGAALACAVATFILLIPANLLPLMTVNMLGNARTSVLASGIGALWGEGYAIVAVLLGAFGIAFPLVRFGGLSLVLGAILFGERPRWLGPLYRWVMELDLWAMPDVFLIGFFIGYSRVSQSLHVTIGLGGLCFILAALLTMLTRACLDRRSIWRAIAPERDAPPTIAAISCTACDLAAPASEEGRPCPRCGLTLRSRKRDAMVRAAALSLAALVLYFPANLYPMSEDWQAGKLVTHRIIDGVRELFEAGLWPFAILIIGTSIVIPMVKILGMGWFVISAKRQSRRFLRLRTRLYRLIDELGRWSNVDVFTIIVFVPLLQFTPLTSSRAAPGATAFTLVVFFTMLASRFFDPRLMWDAAKEAGE